MPKRNGRKGQQERKARRKLILAKRKAAADNAKLQGVGAELKQAEQNILQGICTMAAGSKFEVICQTNDVMDKQIQLVEKELSGFVGSKDELIAKGIEIKPEILQKERELIEQLLYLKNKRKAYRAENADMLDARKVERVCSAEASLDGPLADWPCDATTQADEAACMSNSSKKTVADVEAMIISSKRDKGSELNGDLVEEEQVLIEENVQLSANLVQMKEQLTKQTKVLEEARDELVAAQNDNQELEKANDLLNAELVKTQNQLKQSKAALTTSQRKCEQFSKKESLRQDKLDKANRRYQIEQLNVAKLQDQLNEIEKHRASVLQLLKTKDEQIMTLQQRIAVLCKLEGQAFLVCKDLGVEDLNQVSDEMAGLCAEVKRLGVENDKLVEQLHLAIRQRDEGFLGKDARITGLEKQIADLEAKLQRSEFVRYDKEAAIEGFEEERQEHTRLLQAAHDKELAAKDTVIAVLAKRLEITEDELALLYTDPTGSVASVSVVQDEKKPMADAQFCSNNSSESFDSSSAPGCLRAHDLVDKSRPVSSVAVASASDSPATGISIIAEACVKYQQLIDDAGEIKIDDWLKYTQLCGLGGFTFCQNHDADRIDIVWPDGQKEKLGAYIVRQQQCFMEQRFQNQMMAQQMQVPFQSQYAAPFMVQHVMHQYPVSSGMPVPGPS